MLTSLKEGTVILQTFKSKSRESDHLHIKQMILRFGEKLELKVMGNEK
jgi:hypothetical protein